MKKMLVVSLGAVSLALVGGSAFAQDHSHGGHDHDAASQMPTMEECQAMHDEMMGDSSDHHDEASRRAMMENMDEAKRTRMQQCHEMMQSMHGHGQDEDQAVQGHDHQTADTGHRH
jgi:hypothetical protein